MPRFSGSRANARIGELRRCDEKGLWIAGFSLRVDGPDGSTVLVEALHGLCGDGGGEVARRVAAHAVEHEVKSEIGSEGEDVLVDGAAPSDLGAAGGFNVQSSRQESSQSARRAFKQPCMATPGLARVQRVESLTRTRTTVMLSGPPSSLARSTR